MSERKTKLAAQAIAETCQEVCDMLLSKNEAYGNSAFEPVRIFSKADVKEQIRVRMDDKLSRLSRGQAAGEDVYLDLIGYLIIERSYDRYKKLVGPELEAIFSGDPEVSQHEEETHAEGCDCWKCRSIHYSGQPTNPQS